MKKSEWLRSPVCGNKTRLQIWEDTELKNFPLYCLKCKQEALSAVQNFQIIVLNNQTAIKGGYSSKMNKLKTIFLCVSIEIFLIVCVGAANIHPDPRNYFLFYNILYGIVFSFVFPLSLLRKEENPFDFIGVKAVGKKQITVSSIFVVFSVGGQLIPIVVNGGTIPWDLLSVGVIPLIMTTFFEEFLFRGFIQSKIEKDFGALPAILVSG